MNKLNTADIKGNGAKDWIAWQSYPPKSLTWGWRLNDKSSTCKKSKYKCTPGPREDLDKVEAAVLKRTQLEPRFKGDWQFPGTGPGQGLQDCRGSPTDWGPPSSLQWGVPLLWSGHWAPSGFLVWPVSSVSILCWVWQRDRESSRLGCCEGSMHARRAPVYPAHPPWWPAYLPVTHPAKKTTITTQACARRSQSQDVKRAVAFWPCSACSWLRETGPSLNACPRGEGPSKPRS